MMILLHITKWYFHTKISIFARQMALTKTKERESKREKFMRYPKSDRVNIHLNNTQTKIRLSWPKHHRKLTNTTSIIDLISQKIWVTCWNVLELAHRHSSIDLMCQKEHNTKTNCLNHFNIPQWPEAASMAQHFLGINIWSESSCLRNYSLNLSLSLARLLALEHRLTSFANPVTIQFGFKHSTKLKFDSINKQCSMWNYS